MRWRLVVLVVRSPVAELRGPGSAVRAQPERRWVEPHRVAVQERMALERVAQTREERVGPRQAAVLSLVTSPVPLVRRAVVQAQAGDREPAALRSGQGRLQSTI